MTTPQDVSQWIGESLECSHLQVVGDGQHFQVLIVSPVFEGLSSVRRHQTVYKALGARMHAEIHALSMRTLTPDEFAADGADDADGAEK